MSDGVRGWWTTRPRGRWLGLGLVLLLAAAGRVSAQGDPGPAKMYTNKTSFFLPIKLDEASRRSQRGLVVRVAEGQILAPVWGNGHWGLPPWTARTTRRRAVTPTPS